MNQTLAEQLEQRRNETMSSLPDETKDFFGRCFEKLLQSDVATNAKGVGDKAPDFTLTDANGNAFQLSQALIAGPVVLNFYRGGWCPFCNLEFKALQDTLPEIINLGARLVGISPETPDNSLTTSEKHQLTFEVLSDLHNKVASDYGIVMTVFEELRPLYLEWGIDLPTANGDDSYELPLPATYVIDTDGIIQAAYVNKDYTKRMEPTDIISALQLINQKNNDKLSA